jgi:hypothetical protein
LGFAVFGVWYSGWFQHHVFGTYAWVWPQGAALGLSTRLRHAALTVAFHMTLTYPLCFTPSLFGTTELIRGGNTESLRRRFDSHFRRIYTAAVVVWTPCMFVQFLMVPVNLQPLYVSGIAFFWTTWLSWTALKEAGVPSTVLRDARAQKFVKLRDAVATVPSTPVRVGHNHFPPPSENTFTHLRPLTHNT